LVSLAAPNILVVLERESNCLCCSALELERDRDIVSSSNWVVGMLPVALGVNIYASPDAYVQMALQLAWYKRPGSFTAAYETASHVPSTKLQRR